MSNMEPTGSGLAAAAAAADHRKKKKKKTLCVCAREEKVEAIKCKEN